jgi:cysteinyl-tRNA synthetase
MSSIVFDVVRRYLEYRGYEVRHVMNYTDVDDKIIQRANHEGVDAIDLAERYIAEYDQHIQDLNILPATIYPRATEEIGAIIDMVARLLEDDFAYVVDGDVYYRVENKEDYGKLSGRKLEEMQAGARIGIDERKEHAMDFALWKSAKPGEPYWDSPWGPGRPGWHIECSAMVLHHLGKQIDIHGGGNDLVFPHHENEIAQSESLTGEEFARYWMHNGMLQFSGEKMSKSIGNLISIEDFLLEHEADVLRMMVLNSSYRHPLTYGDEVVEQAERALDRLRSGLRLQQPGAPGVTSALVDALVKQIETARIGFTEAMDDDFNTASALAYIFDLVRVINQSRDAGANDQELQPGQDLLRELAGVLGLRLVQRNRVLGPEPFIGLISDLKGELDEKGLVEIQWPAIGGENIEVNRLIDQLVSTRVELRAIKQWALSDSIRDRLASLGVQVEDNPQGSTWRWT